VTPEDEQQASHGHPTEQCGVVPGHRRQVSLQSFVLFADSQLSNGTWWAEVAGACQSFH
jgi:hypothetical protein